MNPLSYRNEWSAALISAKFKKPLDKPDWYKVEASTGDSAEIIIYDVIGWPFNDAGELVRVVSGLRDKHILARINSPGGDLVDAIAVYHAFKEHGNVTTRIESLAASSASIIALGGKDIQAYPSSTFMIHEPWVVAAENIYSVDETRDILNHFSGRVVDIYADNSKIGKREIKQLMKGEEKRDGTWMSAETARDKGFVKTIVEAGKAMKAAFNLSIFAGAPQDVIEGMSENKVITGFDVERILHDAKAPKSFAKAAAAACRAAGLFDRRQADDDLKAEEGTQKEAEAKEFAELMAAARRFAAA